MDQIPTGSADVSQDSSFLGQGPTMSTLVCWNIAKAVEVNPSINLKSALKTTQERLEKARDVTAIVSQGPEDQYLTCALLAWQQLGHRDTDSLYQFVELKQNQSKEVEKKPCMLDKGVLKRPALSPGSFISYEDSKLYSKGVGSSNFDICSLVGPVVKLPVDTKVVMRLDNTPSIRQARKGPPGKELMDKIDAACCMESACMEKLSQLDKSTNELRKRAQRLARREAERVELLERAEAAWKDLELGYQRRLAMAEEKEEDIAKATKKLIEERNGYKNACTTLAKQLRERGEVAEKERAKLTEVEKEMCENACMRLKLSEQAARLDAALAEQQCKAGQLDRDLQFKEEQMRRKLQTLESELESARCLTHEAERALHAELSALREQITKVSTELLEEDAENGRIKEELELYRQEKNNIIEDLDGCKALCDGRIQGKMDALQKKREKLKELKEKVIECQCKWPVDAAVEVRRTPSLAALCKCSPEDKYLDSCSCTSLRTSLLTNLLADLFGGLQSELGGCGSQMPCQLLKCLEDRHNWDKTSIVKTNLRNYFSQLLVGELDIAIATSIEKYHAKWVGASCADAARMIPDRGGPETEGWQERALERRAQKMAAKLAEQLFKEREEQLTAKAKEIVKTGPPPCECKPRPDTAVYPVLVNQHMITGASTTTHQTHTATYWRRTHHDVTQLKVQIDDLKKESIKKEDLKMMEENIVKLVQRATFTEDTMELKKENKKGETYKKNNCIHRSVNTEQGCRHNIAPKLSSIKKKHSDANPKKGSKNFILGLQVNKPERSYKKLGQSYAVNLCLCDDKDARKKIRIKKNQSISQDIVNKKPFKGISKILSQVSSVKQTKPITSDIIAPVVNIETKSRMYPHPLCRSNIVCFHKPPSNTSIDKLLATLAKWKCDLSKLDNKGSKSGSKSYSNKSMIVAPEITNKNESGYLDSCSKVSKTVSACPYKPNVINISQSANIPNRMPMNTESEYLGAVNLDSGSGNQEHRDKGIASVLNTHLTESDDKTSSVQKKLYAQKESQKYSRKNSAKELSDKTQNNANQNESPNIKLNPNKLEKTATFTSDCHYCIKFLGVTLTNATSSTSISEKKSNPKTALPLSTEKHRKKKNNHTDVWYNRVESSATDKLNTQTLCKSNAKYEEDKKVLQRGDCSKNEDKFIDIQSLINYPVAEDCVCCNKESKELEVNAFQLLKEHLRRKLEEFKTSTCKSTCITPEEGEKIFSSILQKVKHIITENTGGITCKCNNEEQNEGSWHRAYMLLEEYLKVKIQRVQCLCDTTENSINAVLPDLLEKVCMLIDNDFNRLKKICKCKTNEKPKNNCEYESDLPEKDINRSMENNYVDENNTFQTVNTFTKYNPFKDNILQDCRQLTRTDNIEKLNKNEELSNITTTNQIDEPHSTDKSKHSKNVIEDMSSNSMTITKNISLQISPCLDNTSTKSCNAIEIGTRSQQTSNILSKECCEITEISYDHCDCTQSTKLTQFFGFSDVIVNECARIHKEDIHSKEDVTHEIKSVVAKPLESICNIALTVKNDHTTINKASNSIDAKNDDFNKVKSKKSVPYIGYTVDCSCDKSLGACTCTKSLITKKNDNLNSIWNTLTSNKLRRNVSYIMEAVGKKNKDDIYCENVVETNNNQKSVKKCTRNSKTGAVYFDDIILKDSKEKLNKNVTSTSTSGDDICFSPDNSEALDWCECNSNMKEKSKIVNDFSDNTYYGSSIYYPMRKFVNRGKSASVIQSGPINLDGNLSSDCDCNMVPMCHVKMLVKSIESKLMHSKCTCDSLSAKICPVHSKKK